MVRFTGGNAIYIDWSQTYWRSPAFPVSFGASQLSFVLVFLLESIRESFLGFPSMYPAPRIPFWSHRYSAIADIFLFSRSFFLSRVFQLLNIDVLMPSLPSKNLSTRGGMTDILLYWQWRISVTLVLCGVSSDIPNPPYFIVWFVWHQLSLASGVEWRPRGCDRGISRLPGTDDHNFRLSGLWLGKCLQIFSPHEVFIPLGTYALFIVYSEFISLCS